MKNKWYKSNGGWIGVVIVILLGVAKFNPISNFLLAPLNWIEANLLSSIGSDSVEVFLMVAIGVVYGFLVGYLIEKIFFKRK